MPRRGYHPDWKPACMLTPHGRHCRRCNRELRSWQRGGFCDAECLHEYRMAVSWTYICQQVYRRDLGVCAECGLKTERLARAAVGLQAVQAMTHSISWGGVPDLDNPNLPANKWLRRIGFRPWERLWQVDHILPRIQGGGNELENLRTLCVPCHKNFTAWLADWRAQQRRV